MTFSIRADDLPHSITSLATAQIKVIRANALNAFTLAFALYNVSVNPQSRQATHTVYVGGQDSLYCAGTSIGAISGSLVYFPKNATEAQYAVNVTSGTVTPVLLGAIGEGIGNNAADEVSHQLLNEYLFAGLIVGGMDLDDDSKGTYNGAACFGGTEPWVYTGYYNGAPVYWERHADQSLTNIFGRRK